MNRSHISKFLLLLMMVFLLAPQVWAQSKKMRAQNRKAAPYTNLLGAIDRVELIKLRLTINGDIDSIVGTKSIEGKQARKIAALWRAQAWSYFAGGTCHTPPFAVRFFSRGKQIFYASICWECENIVVREPYFTYRDFAARSKRGQELLSFFKDAFPETPK